MFQCYKVRPTPYCDGDSDNVMKFRITLSSRATLYDETVGIFL